MHVSIGSNMTHLIHLLFIGADMAANDDRKDKIKWKQVKKWVDRDGLKTSWKVYGMPDILNPFTSAFADIDPMPKWDIPSKVMISTTITGAFFSKAANPHH